MNTGNNNGYTPLNIDLGIKPQPTIGQQRSGSRRNSGSTTKQSNETIQPRVELKPGPWDPGYKKPKNIVMDVIPEAAADPGRRATDPPRQIHPPEETVTNAAGIVQTGKNLGGGGTPINMNRTFDDLLKGVGVQPFSSNQLSSTMSNPYEQTGAQTPGFDTSQGDFGGRAAVNFDAEGGVSAIRSTNLQDQAPFNPGAPLIEGGSERIAQQSTGITSGRLSDALEGVKTQEANREMTPERRQLMARAAFMNDGDSMAGLKARDAVNNVVYAGGQHYGRGALTEDGKLGDKFKIDRADARDIASGKQTASGLLDVYKSRITESQKTTTPVEAQEPPTIEKPGVKQSFGRSETITPGIDTSIPDTTAFNSNNGVDVPAFGNTGGYKPTTKKPDVDYSSIFSY